MPTHRILPRFAFLLIASLASLLAIVGCGGSANPASAPIVLPPVISIFTASPATINPGASSSLSWTVIDATSISISGISGTPTSPLTVSPTTTTTYTLTASNSGGTVSATTTVTVNTAPVITGFTASPASISIGASSSLSWTVAGATSVTLTGVTGQVISPQTISPTTTTTYTLTATNSVGTTTATTTVTVLPAINSFTASATSITAGQLVTFSWTTTGAISTSLSGVTASPISPVTVYPSASGNYTLTATNSSGSVTQSIAITVTPNSIGTTTVGSTAGQLVPSNFMGLGVGESSYESQFGEPATGKNTVLRQIMSNITQYGASPMTFKITAYDQYPASAATYLPTAADVSAINQLYADTGATFFVGVNLAADVPSIAVNQAQAYASQMTPGSLIGLEIGNEPDNYTHSSEQYRTAPYYFLQDYANFASGVLTALQTYQPNAKLVGPVWGEPNTETGGSSGTVNNSGHAIAIGDFLTAQGSNLALVTQHGYANQCINGASYNTDFLLTPAAQDCVSTTYLLGGVAPSHALNLKYRIGELNSITGGGVQGISNTFQASLWIMDLCAGLAKGGVDGVNIFGDSANQYYTMFTFNTTTASGQTAYTLSFVIPQYYGVLMFQQATQNKAQFLPVTTTATGNQVVYAWLDASDTIRVLVLNKDESGSGTVTVTLPTGYGQATVTRLLESTPNASPAYLSTAGVTLGGQTFDTSTNGVIQGNAYGEVLTPTGTAYTIALPLTSAALLTIPHN